MNAKMDRKMNAKKRVNQELTECCGAYDGESGCCPFVEHPGLFGGKTRIVYQITQRKKRVTQPAPKTGKDDVTSAVME